MRNLALDGALVRGLVLSSLLMTGCLNTRTGQPIKPGQKPVFVSQQRVPGLNTPLPDHWRRVFIGELPRPRLDGYMRTRVIPQDDYSLTLHWVYDDHFHLVGVMTDLGKTTRFDKQGEPHNLGFLDTEEGLLALLGHHQRGKVHMVDMPAPAE